MTTLAVKNQNPGNLKDPSTGAFRQFSSPQEGLLALKNDLNIKISGKSKTGVKPTSSLYDFASIYAPKSDNNDPVRYAQNLGKQLGVPPETPISSLAPRLDEFAQAIAQNEDKSMAQTLKRPDSQPLASAQVNVPDRSKLEANIQAMEQQGASKQEVQSYLDSLKSSQTVQPKSDVGGNYPTAPEAKPFESANQQQEIKPEKGLLRKGAEFLFPILEDKKRTPLETVGDIGMSVLPFVPGLGELGLAAKGAKALGVASKVAKGAKVAEEAGKTAGLISKVAKNPIAQATATGYATGASKNLSEGKSVGESIAPNLNTLGGAALGGGASLLAKGVGGIINKATGIPENIKPRLAGLSNKGLYDEYANVGAKRAQDVANPSMIQHGVERATKAVDSIQANLKAVGKKIGDIKVTEGSKKLGDVKPVIDSFSSKLSRFGVGMKVTPNGKIIFKNLPGRVKDVLSAGDKARLKATITDLLKLKKGGNVQKASDVLDNLDNAIEYGKAQKFAGATDPLNGFLKETRHSLNEVIGKSSPALAKAKTRASDLNKVINFLKSEGGNNFQRADLLLKRALTGDKGAIPREVFDIIKKETGVNLMDDAVLINHFTRSMGGEAQSLLEQYLQHAAQGAGGPTVPGLMIDAGKKILQNTVSNPIKVGKRIVEGKGPLLKGLLQRGIPEATALKGGQFLSQ